MDQYNITEEIDTLLNSQSCDDTWEKNLLIET